MKVSSTKFIKGAVSGSDEVLLDGKPHVVFIGRSNVGKSSLLNVLTNSKIARTSSMPGRTQEINVMLVNDSIYFLDLPGYGFARVSGMGKYAIGKLIEQYLFNPNISSPQKIILLVDAHVGMTDKDMAMFDDLVEYGKDFVIAASKIDKCSQSEYHHNMLAIKKAAGDRLIFPFSSKTKKGLDALRDYVLDTVA